MKILNISRWNRIYVAHLCPCTITVSKIEECSVTRLSLLIKRTEKYRITIFNTDIIDNSDNYLFYQAPASIKMIDNIDTVLSFTMDESM